MTVVNTRRTKHEPLASMGKWSYSVIIDAGSSGSRVYVYRWPKLADARKRGKRDELSSLPRVKSKKHWHKKIHPGVSTFGEKPSLVGEDHLKDLYSFALDIVGEDNAAETPIYLLATAGMRLLPDLQRTALLQQICTYTKASTPFKLADCNAQIQVIGGDAEGMYGWVAANYLLGGFDGTMHDHGKGHHTYGFLDMGGASAQIAFAPNSTEVEKHAEDLKLLRLRSVDGSVSEYAVYVTTWLEFGVREARKRYVKALTEGSSPEDGIYPDPCLPKGLTINTAGEILAPDTIDGETVHMIGTGAFAECMRSSYPLLGKDKPCTDEPCLLNGVHAPAIDFDINHFVGVSEYWHTMHGVFESEKSGDAYDFKTYQDQVTDFCSRDWSDIKHNVDGHKWKGVDEALAAEVCFKSSWVLNVLHDGIGIPRAGVDHLRDGPSGTDELLDGAKEVFSDAFQAVDKIDGTEISWTLGKAVLYAASEVPAINTNVLPVGFGSNNGADVPTDWSFGGLRKAPPALMPGATYNDTAWDMDDDDDSLIDSIQDSLFSDNSPRRVPGLVLFLVILCIVVFFICGKDRRNRAWRSFFSRFSPGGVRPLFRRSNPFSHAFFSGGPKAGAASSLGHRSMGSADRDHLMEQGGLLAQVDDFELGHVEGGELYEYPDDNSSSGGSMDKGKSEGPKGMASGWATPTIRTPAMGLDGASDFFSQGGLTVRTDSRDRLHGLGMGLSADQMQSRSRSRRGSPTRLRSPMMTPLAED